MVSTGPLPLIEPPKKRVVAFFDAQNLIHAAKDLYGYQHPNFKPAKLVHEVCKLKSGSGWQFHAVRLYSGVHDIKENRFLHLAWSAQLLQMTREGVHVTKRPLKYSIERVTLENNLVKTVKVPREKGIDIRLALDVVRMARENEFDVALIFSQDQDLAEAANEVSAIAKSTGRWIKVASAYPISPASTNLRGIDGTDWVKIEREVYDRCLDTRDYRPKGV